MKKFFENVPVAVLVAVMGLISLTSISEPVWAQEPITIDIGVTSNPTADATATSDSTATVGNITASGGAGGRGGNGGNARSTGGSVSYDEALSLPGGVSLGAANSTPGSTGKLECTYGEGSSWNAMLYLIGYGTSKSVVRFDENCRAFLEANRCLLTLTGQVREAWDLASLMQKTLRVHGGRLQAEMNACNDIRRHAPAWGGDGLERVVCTTEKSVEHTEQGSKEVEEKECTKAPFDTPNFNGLGDLYEFVGPAPPPVAVAPAVAQAPRPTPKVAVRKAPTAPKLGTSQAVLGDCTGACKKN